MEALRDVGVNWPEFERPASRALPLAGQTWVVTGKLEALGRDRIVANPNCCTIPLTCVLKPLHDAASLRRVHVATYQSVSGAGKEGMDELFNQTRGVYMNQSPERTKFTKQIAFNVIPHIDVFMEDGQTKEEWKMMVETRKILDPDIPVTATCVRVPVFIGHAEAINLELEKPLDEHEARRLLAEGESVRTLDVAPLVAEGGRPEIDHRPVVGAVDHDLAHAER